MALTKKAIRHHYPLPVFNYRVMVDGHPMSFSEVSGLDIEYEKVVYKHGFSYLTGPNVIRAGHNLINVILKRGVVAKKNALYTWLSNKHKKTVIIDLCDEKGAPVVRWTVLRAMPLKMTAPSFAAATSDVAIESIELIAQSLSIEYF